jgi:hemoglobin
MYTATTLYEKLGGEQAVEQIVNDFYERVLADNTVNHFFTHTDMEKQRRHQTAFISYALGASKQYTGRSMEQAHANLNLQPEHFEAITKHLSDALIAFGASAEEINSVVDRVGALRKDILYK